MTSLAGRSPTPVELRSKKIYSDDTGDVWITVEPFGLLLSINYMAEPTISNMKHWRDVIANIDLFIGERGYDEYFTLVGSKTDFNFAKFYGFETAGVTFSNKYELMRKTIDRT